MFVVMRIMRPTSEADKHGPKPRHLVQILRTVLSARVPKASQGHGTLVIMSTMSESGVRLPIAPRYGASLAYKPLPSLRAQLPWLPSTSSKPRHSVRQLLIAPKHSIQHPLARDTRGFKIDKFCLDLSLRSLVDFVEGRTTRLRSKERA